MDNFLTVGHPFTSPPGYDLSAYVGSSIAILLFATIARIKYRPVPPYARLSGDGLDVFQVAYLAGGPVRVTETVVTSLVGRGLLDGDGDVSFPTDLHPVEKAALTHFRAGSAEGQRTLGWSIRRQQRAIKGQLLREGMWVHAGDRQKVTATVAVMLSIPFITGLILIQHHLHFASLLPYTIWAVSIVNFLGILILLVSGKRTDYGQATLELLRQSYGPARVVACLAVANFEDMAFAVSLKGLFALHGPDGNQSKVSKWLVRGDQLGPRGKSER